MRHLEDGSDNELNEGVTQGNPLSMMMYGDNNCIHTFNSDHQSQRFSPIAIYIYATQHLMIVFVL